MIDLLGDDVTSAAVSNVLSLLSDMSTSTVPEHLGWVNLQNGRWCLDSWNLLEHSPIYKSIVQLPVAYEPKAQCPEFSAWLSDVLPAADDQFLLLQLFGYSMLQDVRFGKIVVLFGPTHTGKSTCLDVLKAFLGKDNVSALSLHALDNEQLRFSRSGLVGKLANVSADLSSKYLRCHTKNRNLYRDHPLRCDYQLREYTTQKGTATHDRSLGDTVPASHASNQFL